MPKHTSSKSPFHGYTLIESAPSGGKQVKAPGTGLYRAPDGRLCFIKKAPFPGDDVAEVIASRLLKLLGANAAEVIPVRNNKTGEIFIASFYAEGTEHKPLHPQGTVSGLWTEDEIRIVHEKILKHKLVPEMCKALVASLLVGEYDVHPGNFVLYLQENLMRVMKIDHGWALHMLSTQKNEEPMLGRNMWEQYGDTRRFTPLNHFKNYPQLISSLPFVIAMQSVLQRFEEIDRERVIFTTLQEFENLSGNTKQYREVLKGLARHISNTILQKQVDKTSRYDTVTLRMSQVIDTKLQERAYALSEMQNKLQTQLVVFNKLCQ